MSSSYVIFGILAVGCALVLGSHVTKEAKIIHINLTDRDIVSGLEPRLKDNRQQYRFIGDLVIGERHADETIFKRSVEISNPTDQVYNSAIMLNVERGVIHYVSVMNEKNSYAVACDEPYSLGHSRTTFNVRVPPNTKSQLWLLVAAH